MAKIANQRFYKFVKDGFKEWKTGLGTPGLFKGFGSKGISLEWHSWSSSKIIWCSFNECNTYFWTNTLQLVLLISFLSRVFGSTTAQSKR